jgi:hypothetical protein
MPIGFPQKNMLYSYSNLLAQALKALTGGYLGSEIDEDRSKLR